MTKAKILTGNPVKLSNLLITIFMMCIAVILLLPIFVVFTTAFKSDTEVALAGFRWFPSELNLENFRKAMSMGNWSRYFLNSIIVTSITVIGSLFFNSLAGYTFARLRFRGKQFLFILIMIGMMIPPQAIIIPQFVMLRSVPLLGGNNLAGEGGVGLLNTYWALIIPFLSGSFGIFLCRQFYISFPTELDDAAKIDGCTPFQTYWKIYFPMSTQIFATLCILKTVATWNDFFYPLIMTQNDKTRTIQLALQLFKGSTATHWNWLMAGTVITIIPVVLIFLFAQKYFVQSIASTGMKN